MTENHHQDKAMRDEIKRVLNNQKSDDKLLSLLVSTKPRASTDFQNNLEDKLIEQLTVKNKYSGDTIMTEFNDKPKHKKKPSRLPFTLVAAVIAIVLVGGLILFTTSNRGTPYDSYDIPEGIALTATQIINDATTTAIVSYPPTVVENFGLTATAIIENVTATAMANNNQQVQATTTITPTATPITNENLQDAPDDFNSVVIAVRNIQAGIEITSEDVTLIDFPSDSTPSNVFSNIDDVIGLVAQTHIQAEAPLRTYLLAEAYREDFGRFLIALRDIELNEVITDEMVTTVQYDFEDTNWFMDEDNPGAIYFNNEATVIGQRASTFIPYHQPIHSNNITESQNCEDSVLACAILDESSVLMELSVIDRSALALPLGTQVDIIAALQYIDIGDESQAIVDTSDLPLDIVPSITIDTIVSNAILLNAEDIGDTITVTIALSPQDAMVLEYILEAGLPLRFAPHIEQSEQTNQSLRFSPDYPQTTDGLAIISIPLEQVNTDNIVNIGDTFDIQFSILPDAEDLILATPQAGDVIYNRSSSPISNCCGILEIENTTVLYVGSGTSDFPNPTNDDSLFMSISVNPNDAWIVDWYVNNGAEFTLNP
ncbi:MAG: hypothetical protein Phog2KO_15700 [Phototrophicaceae bacterium]